MRLQVDRFENKIVKQKPTPENKNATVLCLLDYVLGNMIIHYSNTRVLHPRQGFEDVLEVVREENWITDSTKMIYLLIGRADIQSAPGSILRAVEVLLNGLARIQPKIMVVLGAIIVCPSDTREMCENIFEVNRRLAKVADFDHHWLFFDSNASISLAGNPQKRFFDKDARINKAGCLFIAQGLVATSKAARMLQKFNELPPKDN